MSVNVLITFHVREDKRASFTDLLQTVKVSLPTVPGCQAVRVYNDLGDPLSFILVETWDSAQAHTRHLQSLQASGQWASVTRQLVRAPVSTYCREI